MPEGLAKVPDGRTLETVQPDQVLTRASRVGVWGTLAFAGSIFGSAILGPSIPLVEQGLVALGGVGAALGGIGVAIAGIRMLRRPDVRLQWRIVGALSAPFGASLVTWGLYRLLWRPTWVVVAGTSAFNPPLLYRLALYGIMILGPIVALVVGADIARFVVRVFRSGGEADDPKTRGGPHLQGEHGT